MDVSPRFAQEEQHHAVKMPEEEEVSKKNTGNEQNGNPYHKKEQSERMTSSIGDQPCR